jgi:hypothetical protein
MNRVKNSVGIWSFGANATRFMPSDTTRQQVERTWCLKCGGLYMVWGNL